MLPQLPVDVDELAAAMPYTATSQLHQAITNHAKNTAEQAHPDHRQLRTAAQSATAQAHEADNARAAAARSRSRSLDRFGSLAYTDDPPDALPKPNTPSPSSPLSWAVHGNVSARSDRSPRSAP